MTHLKPESLAIRPHPPWLWVPVRGLVWKDPYLGRCKPSYGTSPIKSLTKHLSPRTRSHLDWWTKWWICRAPTVRLAQQKMNVDILVGDRVSTNLTNWNHCVLTSRTSNICLRRRRSACRWPSWSWCPKLANLLNIDLPCLLLVYLLFISLTNKLSSWLVR